MKKGYRPLAVFYGYPSGKRELVFLGRAGELVISGHAAKVLSILRLCNGYTTVEEITATLPELPFKEVSDIVSDLERQGIVCDARELYARFHLDSANPQIFSSGITPAGLKVLARSPGFAPNVESTRAVTAPESTVLLLAGKRQTTRVFSDDPMPAEVLNGLFLAMYQNNSVRTTPSAGGLYPLRIFVAVLNRKSEVSVGLYYYDPREATLGRVPGAFEPENVRFVLQNDCVNAAFAVFVAADMYRFARKYANRGYRFALLEAGHVAQNAYLYGAEKELGILEYGGFEDKAASELLGLKYPREAVLISLIVGWPGSGNPQPAPDFAAKILGPDKPVKDLAVRRFTGLPRVLATSNYKAPDYYRSGKMRTQSASGTALTEPEARAKAIAEAFERWACSHVRIDVRKPAKQLHEPWLDPREAAPFTAEQYRKFRRLRAFDESAPWQWVRGRRAATGESVLVPIDLVYYPISRNFQREVLRRPLCYETSSNGVAAHTDVRQAETRALLELIERDALMVTWYAKKQVTALSESIASEYVQSRTAYWRNRGFRSKLLNLTLDSLPVVLAVIYSGKHYPYFICGASAASSFSEAVDKAWVEAEIMLLVWQKGPRKGRIAPRDVYSPTGHGRFWASPSRLKTLGWLLDAPEENPKPEFARDAVKLFNPAVVEVGPKKYGLTVVRAVAEKLLPINFGYGNEHLVHGRLTMLDLKWERGYPSLPHFFA